MTRAQTRPVLEIRIADRDSDAEALARLFAGNLTKSYISHEELQCGRALARGKWAPDIQNLLHSEVVERLGPPMARFPRNRNWRGVVEAKANSALVGLAFVTITVDAPTPFGTIADIVIDTKRRGTGFGRALIGWILDRFAEAAITRTFLESGVRNKDAHRLFTRLGYKTLSIVMMREN